MIPLPRLLPRVALLLLAFFPAVGRAQSSGAPTVASLSSSQTLTEGQNLTLSVSVNGTAPFSYQWRKDGVAINGATSSSLSFTPLRAADAGTYTVVITNAIGNVTSGPVVLAVNRAVAPSFSYQPSAVSYTVGDTINLYVSVNGTGPLSYVWKRGTTTLATTTTNNYSKAGADSSDAGSYTVTVSNIAGSATSNAFTVSVNPVSAPTISYGPYDTTVATGGYISFYPSVYGTGTITYQWKKDGVAISGATGSGYSKSNLTSADAGNYTLTATNSAGSVTSTAAKVTVLPPVAPTISSVSGPVTVTVGDSFSLSVYANGTGPLTYQWRKDGVAITGATSNYYSKSSVQAADAGSYSVVVTNSQGSVTSNDVTVAVTSAQPPIITYHPASFALRQGDYLYSISVGASGTGPLTYEWRKNGVAIPGGTSSSLYFGHVISASDVGAYTVVVSSAQGSVTSEPCNISILPAVAPTITQQIPSQTIRQGQSISFNAAVAGSPAPTIQWRKDGAAISGATSSYYFKANAASSDAGVYSFVATNSAGSVTSDNATVTVIAPSAPQIIAHPASASLLPGDYFYGLYVNTRSASNVTIQWYRDGVAIPGATNSSYGIYNAQPSVAGTYTAVVTNSAGSVTSRDAVITVDANTTRPVITYVQGGYAVSGGSSASMSISTSSSGETVQWFKDGTPIPNATSKDYSFSNFSPSSVGTYTVQVTNTTGTFTSRPIALELLDAGVAPLITVQPTSQNPVSGQSAGFSIQAEGEAPLTYQWRKDGTSIPGATSNSYYLSNITAANAGAYSVVVTNRNGTATSTAVALTLAPTATAAPVIVSHPASRTLTSGSTYLSLGVNLLDSTGATYQWRKNDTPIAGATSSSLYFYSITAATAGRYSVVVTNSAGSATSYDAVISVTSAATGPTFTTQPQSQAAYYGNTVTFSATATSSLAITYQWRKDGTAIAGATSATLTLSNVQSGDAATYTLIATDANGATPSTAATLTLSGGVAPFIASGPVSYTATAGSTATFSVSVGGTPAPSVQWRKNGVDVPGATSATLILNNVQGSDGGSYTAVVRNPVGSVTSPAATLTVVYPPPTISSQPTGASLLAGASFTLSVTAITYVDATYQWRKDGVAITGANDRTLALSTVQSASSGRYSVVVTTPYGSVTSVDAVVSVGNPVTASMPRVISAVAGNSVTFTAAIQSVDPLRYQWARNGVAIPGATAASFTLPSVQSSDVGIYSLGIFRTDGTVVYPLTGSAALTTQLTVELRLPPIITQQPVGATVAIGANVTLTVAAQDTGPIAYQWQKNGVPLPDRFSASLTLTNVQPADAADYRAVAIGANGSTASNVVRVNVTGSAFAGTYFGSLSTGDTWAMHVKSDGSAVFIAVLSGRGQAIVERSLTVRSTGAFTFGFAPAVASADTSGYGARFYTGVVSGVISGGTVTGQVPGASVSYSGQRIAPPATGAVSSGFCQGVPLASTVGEIDAIVAPDGTVMLVAVDSTGVRGGRGTTDPIGVFRVSTPQYTYTGVAGADTATLQGAYESATGGTVSFAPSATAASPERLVNVATRGLGGSGARTLTAGFVISGSGSKEVLIRAIGPALSAFGVTGVLTNPRLRIFRDGAAILENDDWGLGGFAGQITDVGNRVGAFPLPQGSADAAILARLEPGAYTAQVSTDGATSGVALVEVYDTAATTPAAPKLVNLSTRGEVGRDGDILIVGLVVNGTAAKKVLIRGIGPALADFGVSGALADPRLQLYRGPALMRENDNWSDSADAAAVAAAASSVAAFALPSGSKDAALLLYLAPGSYTAQVSGVGNTTGVALVEAYEVP